jgi:carbonic anhydrase
MEKLIKGIVNFRKTKQAEYCSMFSGLALNQSPDALLIGCSDSRVVPNIFASTDPGDLFTLRNIGNLVPPYSDKENLMTETSVAATLEFSLHYLNVSHIIICGHSECGAMRALIESNLGPDLLLCKKWLENATPSYERFKKISTQSNLSPCNVLSRINVLQQLEHLKTYPEVSQRLQTGKLKIHGWWFDLVTANIFHHDLEREDFILIDELETKKMLASL